MITAEEPAISYVRQLADLDATPGVLTASIGVGYQWQDSPVVQASAVVVGDGSLAASQDAANGLGHWLWENREQWRKPPLSAEEGLARGEEIGEYPIILADQGDNPGGGAPSDATEVLRLFQEQALQPSAVLYIVDPEAAAAAHEAGQGAVTTLEIGGKSDPRFGPPVVFDRAQITALSDGRFTYDGPSTSKLSLTVREAAALISVCGAQCWEARRRTSGRARTWSRKDCTWCWSRCPGSRSTWRSAARSTWTARR